MTIAPGIHWVRMPLPFVLDHINLWLLEDGAGSLLVDTGIGFDSVKETWNKVLAAHDRPIRRIIVTHCHPDHLGLASWLMERTGAPLLMTQGELLLANAWWSQLPGFDVTSMLALFRRHGLATESLGELATRGPTYSKRVPDLPRTYERLIDGDEVSINGNAWRVIAGYGHSPEHAALYCEEQNVLISGDMVLPRISTNVSVLAATPDDDPLKRYLDSLRRFQNLPQDVLVLPSHGRPFRGLHTRIMQLEQHHRDRCDELLEACRQAPRCAAELIPVLFRRELDAHQIMFAMGEAIAHLNYLEHAGRLRRQQDGDVLRYFVEAK